MYYESYEKHEWRYLLGIYTGKCLTGWCECRGEYNIFNFYYKTARKCPSGLYYTWKIGLLWWEISSMTLVVSISKILNTPDLNPATNCKALGLPDMQVHTSVFG